MILEILIIVASNLAAACVGVRLGRRAERKLKREDVQELVHELRTPYRDAADAAPTPAPQSERLRAMPPQRKCPRCGSDSTRIEYYDCGAGHPIEQHEHAQCGSCGVVWFEQCPENYEQRST